MFLSPFSTPAGDTPDDPPSRLPNSTPRKEVAPFFGAAGVSVALHGLLLLVLAGMTWTAGSDVSSSPGEYQVHVVSAPQNIGVGKGFQFPGKAELDRPDSARSAVRTEEVHDLAAILAKDEAMRLPADSVGKADLGAQAFKDLRRSDVVGTGDSGGASEGGLGSGLGNRELAGGGPVGSLWGVGEGQNAKSVIYVMDRSASMSDTFELLQRELMRAIGSLSSDQRFNVFWFNEGRATELFPALTPATTANKRKSFEAIKTVVPRGQTQPLDAVRRALSQKPDVLFLLSDGDFGDDNRKIVQTIQERNRSRATIINTILFVYDTMGDGERVLRQIAETNSGVFKHVTEEDVRR